MLDFYGERGVVTFRKYLKAYLAPYDIPREDLIPLLKTKDADEVRQYLKSFFQNMH